MPLVIRALIVVVLLGGAIGLLLVFDVLSVVRQALARGWQWIVRTLVPLGRVYAMRRAASPFWRVAGKATVALLGIRFVTLLRSYFRGLGGVWKRAVERWKALPVLLRWGIASVIVFVGGFVGLGIFIVPLWIPGLWTWIRSFHFMWFDALTGRWIRPMQKRFRRTMRTNPFWRVVRRPHRVVMYLLFVHSRRLVRGLKRRFGRKGVPAAAATPPAPSKNPSPAEAGGG